MAGEDRRVARTSLGLPEERVLPSNIDVEQAVLGILMMHSHAFARCSDILDRDCFFEDLHRRIYDVIEGLITQDKPATPITLKTYLGNADLGGVTIGQYLARLAAEVTVPSNIREYASILNDLKVRREVISIAMDMQEQAYNAPVETTAKSLVDSAVDRLAGLRAAPGEATDFEDFSSASYRAIRAAEEVYQKGGCLVGTSTGIPKLDDAIGGLQKTDLIILAGRPAMGKTSLATNIAFNVAKDLQERRHRGEKVGVVGFNSLEMSAEQLSQRIISEQAGVALWKVRRGFASAQEMEAFVAAQRELNALPISIDQTGELTIAALRLRARTLKKRKGLELLVVDYLQLLKGSSKKGDNRVQEVTEITTGLKALAKELNVPIIALSQLSRDVEKREDKRPMLADLRESGSIEQDADIVMFVYREEYYLKKQKPPMENTEARLAYDRAAARAKGVAEVIIGKNRHGPETTIELGFDANVTRFINEPEEREELPEPGPREKKKAPLRLPKKATSAIGILRSLTITQAIENQGLENVPARVKPVSYLLWREKCAEQLLDVDRDERAAAKLMEEVVPALKEAELIGRGGTKEAPYVWLTEKGNG